MKKTTESFRLFEYAICTAVLLLILIFCVCVGSINLPFGDTMHTIWQAMLRQPVADSTTGSVILQVRLPRVICVALVGAALALSGVAMQGLLRNPLADSSTMGVSAGASLGAVIAIAFSISFPRLPISGATMLAIVFAFISLVAIMTLAYKLDYSLATNTIILIGVIFSMFINSIISFIITFAGDKIKSITFWTLGSLAGSTYLNVLMLLFALILFGAVIMRCSTELNAFAIGEDNARHIGVNVKKVKFVVMAAISGLVGVCVSIAGTIGFVGLVMPHITRMLVGPNHKRLLPASLYSGAVFLLLADLISRVIMRPLELPIGVVTSFIGSMVFVYIFYTTRKGR